MRLARDLCLASLLGATAAQALPASDQPGPAPAPERKEAAARPLGLPISVEQIRRLMGKAIRDDPQAYAPKDNLAFGLKVRDLPELNLRRADLRDLDLRRARLAGRDLTGARLDRADLTGVSLEGARLFGATTFFTRGLDLDGAQLHPFFAGIREAPAGELRWLDLAGADGTQAEPPRALASTPDFPLVYVTGDGRRQVVVAATGITFDIRLESRARILGVAADARKRLVSLAEDGLRFISIQENASGRLEPVERCAKLPVSWEEAGSLLSVRGYPSSAAELAFSGMLMRFRDVGHCEVGSTPHPPGRVIAHALYARNGKTQILAVKDQNLLLHRTGTGTDGYALPAGTTCAGLALGPDGRVWCTYTGTGGHGLAVADLAARTLECFPFPEPGTGWGPRQPGAPVVLPGDQGVWYPDGGGRIGRLVKRGGDLDLEEWPLPDGDQPVALTPAFDGRLLFTLKGRSRIGSIQAKAPAADGKDAGAAPAADGEDAGAAGVERQAGRVRRTGRERRERAYRLDHRQREAAMEAPEPVAGPAESAPEPVAAPAGGTEPEAHRMTAQDLLRANRVTLTPERLAAIRNKHGFDRRPDKSQFAETVSGLEALADLIARGLDESGAIGRIRSHTVDGSYKTLCRHPGVGYCYDGAGWVATDWFVVVTTRTMDGAGDLVKTAYPVTRHGI